MRKREVTATSGLANLDFIRATAVLFVVASHLVPAFVESEGIFHWQALGILGVAIFFVHTCLVLMYSLERQRRRSGTVHFVPAFYLRRSFRIYPLSVLVVGLSFALALLRLAPEVPTQPGTLLSNLLLVQNITGRTSVPAVLWSLPFEIQMYLVLPLIFAWVQPSARRGAVAIARLWIGSVSLILLAALAHFDYRLFRYVPCFLPGILAFSLSSILRPRLSFWVLPALLVLDGLLFPILVQNGVPETVLAWPMCLTLGCLIPLTRQLRLASLAWPAKIIAKYSYGLYLTHPWMIWLVMNRLRGGALVHLTCFFVGEALVVGLLFHLVEEPGIRLGARWIESWTHRPTEPDTVPPLRDASRKSLVLGGPTVATEREPHARTQAPSAPRPVG